MRVALAYPAFYGAFKEVYPELDVMKLSKNNVTDFDLIIFSGGEDINPAIYGGNTQDVYGYNEERDKIELTILDRALTKKVKVLGVCRGHQLINAYMGTKLVQDIYTKFKKSHEGRHSLNYHSELSLIKYILQGEEVNSMHHQGFEPGGCRLTITSTYENIVESCEHPDIITTQFHPEFFEEKKSIRFFENINRWVRSRQDLEREIMESFGRNIPTSMPNISRSGRAKKNPYSFSPTTTWNTLSDIDIFRHEAVPPEQQTDLDNN